LKKVQEDNEFIVINNDVEAYKKTEMQKQEEKSKVKRDNKGDLEK
jgi:hypothetical protein